jgi:hypothetical protein
MPDRSKSKARRSVVPGPPGWVLDVGLMTPLPRNHGGGQDPHRVLAPVKKKNSIISGEECRVGDFCVANLELRQQMRIQATIVTQ